MARLAVILGLVMAVVAGLALPAGAGAAPAPQWVITPVPTPTTEVISSTVSLGTQQAQIYEELRYTNLLLLFFLPVMAGALIFAFWRVRVR